MNWLLRRVLALGVQFRVRPENAAALLQGCSHPVCYVLERRSVTDLAVLQEACLALKLPRPGRRAEGPAFLLLSDPAAQALEHPSRGASPDPAGADDPRAARGPGGGFRPGAG